MLVPKPTFIFEEITERKAAILKNRLQLYQQQRQENKH